MKFSPSITALIEALRCLPGVGPKSAQRMTLHLLERDRSGGSALAEALSAALTKVARCDRCRNFTELTTCEQIRVMKPIMIERVYQRSQYVLLPNHLLKGAGSPFARKNLISHSYFWPNPVHASIGR